MANWAEEAMNEPDEEELMPITVGRLKALLLTVPDHYMVNLEGCDCHCDCAGISPYSDHSEVLLRRTDTRKESWKGKVMS